MALRTSNILPNLVTVEPLKISYDIGSCFAIPILTKIVHVYFYLRLSP